MSDNNDRLARHQRAEAAAFERRQKEDESLWFGVAQQAIETLTQKGHRCDRCDFVARSLPERRQHMSENPSHVC